jgi:hypothetical protein
MPHTVVVLLTGVRLRLPHQLLHGPPSVQHF